VSDDPLRRGAQTLKLRKAAVRLGLQTGLAVAVVVVALVGVALAVVLRSQQSAAVDLIHQTVRNADDVTDPPAGAWLVIRTPTKLLTTKGLPAGFPDGVELDAAAAGKVSPTLTREVGGKDYLVYTQVRKNVVVQGVLDLSADHAERDRLVSALMLSGGVGLVLAALSGAFLASRAMKPLASALALQRRFVADASHELRTPLTLLSTRAQLVQRGLRRHEDPSSLATDIDGLVTDAGNLAMVLEDLLLAADPRGSTGDEQVDLCLLAEQVVAACRPAAVAAGVDVTCAAQPEPVVVTASPGAIRRAVTALVDNAVRHATSEVNVSIAVRGAQAVIEVSDDGPGIDVEMLPRLFDRFESSGDAAASDGAGSGEAGERRRYGLGLALVSEVAARHHGEVSARNRVRGASSSGGATLELALPYAT
jgi:two-component system, OmpR family, sensor kinase